MEAVVVSDRQSQDDGELTLRVGDIIEEVVPFDDTDLWFGNLNGTYGLFNRNAVEVKKVAQHSGSTPTSSAVPGDDGASYDTHDQHLVATGTTTVATCHDHDISGRGSSLHRNQAIKRAVTSDQKPSVVTAPMSSTCDGGTSGSSDGNAQDSHTHTEQATVVVSYEAIDDDELSIQIGDVVDVISKTTGDKGWWKVRLGKSEGIVPAPFLSTDNSVPAHTHTMASGPSTEHSEQESTNSSWLTLVEPGSVECITTPTVTEATPIGASYDTHDQHLVATGTATVATCHDHDISGRGSSLHMHRNQAIVRLGKSEGIVPAPFLSTDNSVPAHTHTMASGPLTEHSEQESTNSWLKLVEPGSVECITTPTVTEAMPISSTTTASSPPDNTQLNQHAVTPNTAEVHSVPELKSSCSATDSESESCHRLNDHVIDVAKPPTVTVSEHSQADCLQTSASVPDVNSIDFSLRTISAHCMLIPILLSLQAIEVISIISQRCSVKISLFNISRQHQPLFEVIKAIGQLQPPLLQKVCVKDYLFPVTHISVFYDWSYYVNTIAQMELLPPFVAGLLNDQYLSCLGGQRHFQIDGICYVADLSAMTLTDTMSGRTTSLHKESNLPTWLFSLDQNNEQFLNFVQNDAISLETMYRYGGSSIDLSRVENDVVATEFISMRQVNVTTGKITPIKRNPPPFSDILPDYNSLLSISGPSEIVDSVAQEIMSQLDSLCTTTSFVHRLTGTTQHWQDIIAVHALNMLRQYCVKLHNFRVQHGTLSVVIQGERDYCARVKSHLKEQLLDLLQYAIEQESKLRSETNKISLPTEWEPQTSNVEFKMVSKTSQEWREIDKIIHETLPRAVVVQIERIQNCRLWEKYALERNHMHERNFGTINEKLLFHGTRRNDPKTVAGSKRGIDFRLSRRDTQLLWGSGAYFAVNASYSDRYSHENCQLCCKQLIIVKVLTGHSIHYSNPHPHLTHPPPRFFGSNLLYDSVHGYNSGSEIYVVYDHDQTYPAYIISYQVKK